MCNASTKSTRQSHLPLSILSDKNLYFTLCEIVFLCLLQYFGYDASSSVLQELILVKGVSQTFYWAATGVSGAEQNACSRVSNFV